MHTFLHANVVLHHVDNGNGKHWKLFEHEIVCWPEIMPHEIIIMPSPYQRHLFYYRRSFSLSSSQMKFVPRSFDFCRFFCHFISASLKPIAALLFCHPKSMLKIKRTHSGEITKDTFTKTTLTQNYGYSQWMWLCYEMLSSRLIKKFCGSVSPLL